MEYERLSSLTAQQRDAFGVRDAIQYLALAAQTEAGPLAAAHRFIEKYPYSLATVALEKTLADGDLLQKAVSPATMTDPAWAGFLAPPAILDPLINRLQQSTVLARIPGLQSVPVN